MPRRDRNICRRRRSIYIRPRTDFGTCVDRDGPKQTSAHMWIIKAIKRLRNICGQRTSRTDFETFVDREGPD